MVIGTAAYADTEHEPAAGHVIDRRHLLGEQRCRAQRAQQNLGLQADAFGGAGESGQGDQRLRIVEHQAIQHRQAVEAAGFRTPRPSDQTTGVADGSPRPMSMSNSKVRWAASSAVATSAPPREVTRPSATNFLDT